MGIAEVLTAIFVVCKLMGVIAWSWPIVFLPMIITGGIYLIMVVAWFAGFRSITKKFKKHFIKF